VLHLLHHVCNDMKNAKLYKQTYLTLQQALSDFAVQHQMLCGSEVQ
jgi:hypothetical protein